MPSVTGRINEIKQPRGGYIKPANLKTIEMDDGNVLGLEENVHGSVVGLVVDYMTRFLMGAKKEEAFAISIQGALCAVNLGKKDAPKIVQELLAKVTKLDDASIFNACKVVTFDVWYRNPTGAFLAKDYAEINPDKPTIDNIKTLILRSLEFFKKYGPITKDGFTFEPVNGSRKDYAKMIETGKGSWGGYTATVKTGDGDFLTSDTLWDFKVSKSKPTNKHTLQLLMYWIMGQHSGQPVFKGITKLGLFNPRLNVVYTIEIKDIPQSTIKEIEEQILCY